MQVLNMFNMLTYIYKKTSAKNYMRDFITYKTRNANAEPRLYNRVKKYIKYINRTRMTTSIKAKH